MIDVLIVDDHDIVRGSLRHIVHQAADMTATEAATGLEALEMLETKAPDVVLLDMSLPDVSGLEVLRRMRHLCPEVPTLILSVNEEMQYASRVLAAGASGFLNKGDAHDELITAIRAVLTDNEYISPALAARLSGARRLS